MTRLTASTSAPPMRDCRGCHGTLDPILNLGDIQLTGYLAPDEPARPTAPLFLCACSECTLVQLAHTVPRDLLFTQYWYRSAVNETMQAELAGLVDQAVARVGGLRAGDLVLDIGANDGTLLSRYPTYEPQVMRLAYEPAENLQPSVRQHADLVLPEYFPDQFRLIHTLGGQVRIITSIAMIYAVDDLAPFLTAVAALLAPDGVWIVQFQDLAGMLKMTAFDNIVHEHLCYFSLESFANLLGPYGLTLSTGRSTAGVSVARCSTGASRSPRASRACGRRKRAVRTGRASSASPGGSRSPPNRSAPRSRCAARPAGSWTCMAPRRRRTRSCRSAG